ncbi:MAG: site-specific integrase [Halobacteriales archaeon]|nr:site-specific integrase [Halobacteriales archaeon]
MTGTRFDRRRKLRPSTATSYVARMRGVLRWTQNLDPSVEDAQAYFAYLSETEHQPSDATKRVRYFTVKAWFEWKRRPLSEAEERAFLVPPTPHNAREAPLTMDRIHELLARIPDRRRYALVRTLLATGLRRAEVAALKVEHVDFEARKVWVPEIGEDGRAAAKGGNGGWICISRLALDAIEEHLTSRRLRPDPAAPLFESLLTGGHLTPDAVTDLVGNLTKRYLGQRVTCHEFRHAFASHAAAGGEGRPPMGITALQRQLRHKDKKTTLRYVHAVENLQEAYERSAPPF